MIHKIENFKKIQYLVGNKNFKINSKNPFDKIICDFVSELSVNLNQNLKTKNYPDVKTFAFWCRKQNILNLKNRYTSNSLRLGHGLIFHITPSNIPTNFAYSLMFGLLNGNSNIVKVPSKKFEQVKIICDGLKKILKKNKYIPLRGMISIIRYKNDEVTKEISLLSDVRLIWGGDNSIKNIRKFNLKQRAIDIAFADRFSFCIIDSKSILKLKKIELNTLIQKFYNDTYLVDQNACSSPHLIIWTGQEILKAKKIFWNNLYKHVKKKYNFPEIASMDKYSKLIENLLSLKNIKKFYMYDNLIYVLSLKNLDDGVDLLRGKWGYFYEYNMNDLNKISKFVNKKFQTLTYFGLTKKYLTKFVLDNNLRGIDRIVPIGQALDISFEWDGYDLNKILSRVIDLK